MEKSKQSLNIKQQDLFSGIFPSLLTGILIN